MIKFILKFWKALNSNTSPSAIALGFSLGLLMGQYPPLNLQWVLLLILILFIFKINLPAYTSFLVLFAIIPPFFAPLANSIGVKLLSNPAQQGLWTKLYNNPFWYLTRFNNSTVLGFSVLFIPLLLIFYFFFKWFVNYYRKSFKEKIVKTKFYKVFIKLPLISSIVKMGSKVKLK
ncbi:TIGR03546 family protein [bacterium]|nr:TIGR03546 family protein [bacterium]